MAARILRCTHCRGEMQAAALEGHYGQSIDVDLCRHCNLVWFDQFESVRLSGLGWIALLRHMHAMVAEPTLALKTPLACVRCGAELKPVHNLTRFGRSAAHECPKRHGQYQTFSLLLAERGLVRPMSARDRRTLQEEGRALTCLNCGASVPPGAGDSCEYCTSPLVVLDLQRLLASVMVRHALALPADDARHMVWCCRACGDAVDPTRMSACERCGHALLAPSLSDAMPLLDALEPVLRQVQPRGPKPLGERVRQRRGYRSTAFYRYFVQPLLTDPVVSDDLEWREWIPPALLAVLLIALWVVWH